MWIARIPMRYIYGVLMSVMSMSLFFAGCANTCSDTSSDRKTGLSSMCAPAISIDQARDIENIIPLAIIGSGPAGYTAAMYAARAHIPTAVFEGDLPGGLLTQTTDVENWPGIFKKAGPEIMQQNKKQAIAAGAHIIHHTTIDTLDLTTWPYRLVASNGETYRALSVIVSTGATPKKLDVPGEERYWALGVSSCAVCDAHFYKDADVVVVGGGDSAVEEAIQLSGYAKKVTILVRKGAMRASAAMQQQLSGYANISIKYHTAIKEINGNDMGVTEVVLIDTQTGTESTFATEGVFLAIGHDPNTTLVKDSLALTDHGHIEVHGRSQRTSQSLVYAAGDVEDNTYRQAGVAAASGTRAALDAIHDLGMIGYTDAVAKTLQLAPFAPPLLLPDAVTVIASLDAYQDAIAQSEKPVFIYFYGDDCLVCPHVASMYGVGAQSFAQAADFYGIDRDTAIQMGLRSVLEDNLVDKVPCILVFQDGNLRGRYTGQPQIADFTQYIEQFITE